MTTYFTREHEWVRVWGDSATVGISDHAQAALGDIVFAEVPAVGKTLGDLSIRPRTGTSVIAWTRNGVTESNPALKTKLKGGDIVVLLGSRLQIRRAMSLLLSGE